MLRRLFVCVLAVQSVPASRALQAPVSQHAAHKSVAACSSSPFFCCCGRPFALYSQHPLYR